MAALLEVGERNKAKEIFCLYDHRYRLRKMAGLLPVAKFADELGAGWRDIEDAAWVFTEINRHTQMRPLGGLVKGKRLALIDTERWNHETLASFETNGETFDLIVRLDDFGHVRQDEKKPQLPKADIICRPLDLNDESMDIVGSILLCGNIWRHSLLQPEITVANLKRTLENNKTIISADTGQMREYIDSHGVCYPSTARFAEHILQKAEPASVITIA